MFVEQENIVCALKWPSIIGETRKKSSFYEEKSLVGLTPGLGFVGPALDLSVKNLDLESYETFLSHSKK